MLFVLYHIILSFIAIFGKNISCTIKGKQPCDTYGYKLTGFHNI